MKEDLLHLRPAGDVTERDLHRVRDRQPIDISLLRAKSAHVAVEVVARVLEVPELEPLPAHLMQEDGEVVQVVSVEQIPDPGIVVAVKPPVLSDLIGPQSDDLSHPHSVLSLQLHGDPTPSQRRALIDTHVHLYDISRFRYDWLDEHPALNRPHLHGDYARASSGSGVDGFFFVEVDCHPADRLGEVEWVTALATTAGGPRLLGVIAAASLDDLRLEQYLDVLADNTLVCGIRDLIDTKPDGFAVSAAFRRGLTLVARHGWPFDLCVTSRQLEDVIDVVDAVPEGVFVLDHLGKPDIAGGEWAPWAERLRRLAARDNVVGVKLSGLLTRAGPGWSPAQLVPYLEHAIESFGPHRVLIGSDWPVLEQVSTVPGWFDLVANVVDGLSADEQAFVEQANALRIYGGDR